MAECRSRAIKILVSSPEDDRVARQMEGGRFKKVWHGIAFGKKENSQFSDYSEVMVRPRFTPKTPLYCGVEPTQPSSSLTLY